MRSFEIWNETDGRSTDDRLYVNALLNTDTVSFEEIHEIYQVYEQQQDNADWKSVGWQVQISDRHYRACIRDPIKFVSSNKTKVFDRLLLHKLY